MTTIILTIIGILLAAAAALMVIFYGGDAFNSGSTGAAANTVQNAGTNVLSSLQLYRSEVGTFGWSSGALTGDGRLAEFVAKKGVGGSYLKEIPSLPTGMDQGLAANGQYSVAIVPAAVCARINANLKITPLATSPSTFAKMVCIPNGQATSPGTFYANY